MIKGEKNLINYAINLREKTEKKAGVIRFFIKNITLRMLFIAFDILLWFFYHVVDQKRRLRSIRKNSKSYSENDNRKTIWE